MSLHALLCEQLAAAQDVQQQPMLPEFRSLLSTLCQRAITELELVDEGHGGGRKSAATAEEQVEKLSFVNAQRRCLRSMQFIGELFLRNMVRA